MNQRALVIGLMSVTLLSLELVWTRLFSAEFFYTYAFLMLSLAVMGMGLGALGARLSPGFVRPALVGVWLSLAGVFSILGPPAVFRLGLDFTHLYGNWAMIGKFILTLFLLGLPFYQSNRLLENKFWYNQS